MLLVFVFVISAEASDGLFWAAKTNGSEVILYRGATPTKGAAQLVGTPAKYLKLVDNTVVAMSNSEKAFVDLPAKYKKISDGKVVEMSVEEKHLVDVPDKYKTPEGTEMTLEQKAAADREIEDKRQAAKPDMQKTLENMYITYLTKDWTKVLIEAHLIREDYVITVENTDTLQNIQYLLYFRTLGLTQIYDYHSNEFNRFKNTLKEYYHTDLDDCKWHPEIVDIKSVVIREIKSRTK